MLAHQNENLGNVFKKYDVDHNYLLSSKEMIPVFQEIMDIKLSKEETDMLTEYMTKKFKRLEITSKELQKLLDMKF